jgi:hypothetical protein
MPYQVVKMKHGCKVCKPDMSKCFSKHPMSHEKAMKQMKALYMNMKMEKNKK